jgi:hypothetical protein
MAPFSLRGSCLPLLAVGIPNVGFQFSSLPFCLLENTGFHTCVFKINIKTTNEDMENCEKG